MRLALIGGCGFLAMHTVAAAVDPERSVHRYVQVRMSPNGAYVAAIEGDSPKGGYYLSIRDLVIRRISDRTSIAVELPCERVPQCWPTSIAWAPDSQQLSFTLRAPGTHTYALYSVSAGGKRLSRLLEFGGTLADLRYSPKGALAMLAIENARKEVGATEAGSPIAGDLDAPPAEQRIGVLIDGSLHWASPDNLFVYEYDWRPDGRGFVGTAAPGDGDNNWWTAKLYAFDADRGAAQLIYSPRDARHAISSLRPRRRRNFFGAR